MVIGYQYPSNADSFREDVIIARFIRYLLYTVLGIVVLTVAAVAVAVFVLDPNDYKPQIEKAVEDRTRLDLNLGGDIGWSLIPLGLELNDVDARLDERRLLKLDRLVARVGLLSLLKMQPAVHTFTLHGLEVNLVRDKSGTGNWERIFPEAEQPAPDKPEPKPAEEPATGGPLLFNVSELDIADARLHYRDEANGQELTLDRLSLQASDIVLGKAFPLQLSFHVTTAEPEVDVEAEITASVTAGEELRQFAVDGLKSRFKLAGAVFDGKQVPATAEGSIRANLDQETVALNRFAATFANVTLKTDLDVRGFGGSPQVIGKVDIPPFSVRELLKQLGQPDIPTSDPAVLRKLAVQAVISGDPGRVDMEPLTVVLDDSTLKGSLIYELETSAITSRLNLDKINADRYLPPQPEQTGEQQKTAQTTPAGQEPELLPLETVRGLRWDLTLDIGQLVANNATITDMKLASRAADGVIDIKPLSGQLYGGSFKATANIDATTSTPRWKLQSNVSNVQTLPLLSDVADMRQFSGLANINADLASSGNRISALRGNAKGQADFAIERGKLEGTNMAAYACQGIALAHRESIDTSGWPKETPFEALSGALTINGNTLNNRSLKAQMKGMALEGQGTVDAQDMVLDYKAGLRILGDVHENPSCRVNEKLTGVVIPVKCEGPLAGEQGLPCKFDTARFRDTLKDLVKAEAKEEIEEEKEKAKEKVREKAQEKLQELFR